MYFQNIFSGYVIFLLCLLKLPIRFTPLEIAMQERAVTVFFVAFSEPLLCAFVGVCNTIALKLQQVYAPKCCRKKKTKHILKLQNY